MVIKLSPDEIFSNHSNVHCAVVWRGRLPLTLQQTKINADQSPRTHKDLDLKAMRHHEMVDILIYLQIHAI